ncbi:MAG: CBS domain-containing protein [Phycisphaeraceae bacterium]|nr:CBS domain-containing protein [Phycisphaeraceae bacterium]
MGLRQDIRNETVAGLSLRPVIRVLATSSVRQAAAKMREAGLGLVVVVDEYDKPLGRFSERDLIRLLAKSTAAIDDPVSRYMTPTEYCVKINDPIQQVFSRMEVYGRRFVCVSNEEGTRMVGLTGQKGLMEYVADHFPRQVKVQELEPKLYMEDREGA